MLTIKGNMIESPKVEYTHRGLARRSFTQAFSIVAYTLDTVKLENGILNITLLTKSDVRPTKIDIK